MIDAIKFRELWEAYRIEAMKSHATYERDRLTSFLVDHADALLALVDQRAAILQAYDGWMVSRCVGDPDTEHKYAQALSTAIFAMKPPPPPETKP